MSEFQPALEGTPQGRTNSLRGMVICLVAGLIVTTVPLVEHAALYGLVVGLLACLLVPLWFRWLRKSLDYFETIHFYGLTYFVYFGLGAVWTVNDPSYVAYDLYIVPYVPLAAFYCLLGYLALLAGYFGPWGRRLRRRRPPERVHGSLALVLTGSLGLAGYAATSVVERSILTGGGVGKLGTVTQLSPLFLFAWALAWLLVFSNQASRTQKLVLFGFLGPGAALTALATFSDKSLIITLIGIPVVARWYAKRKIPWSFIVVLLLILMFVIFPFYNTYRWSDPTMGKVARMKTTYETVQGWDTDRYLLFSVRSFTRRMAMINSVAVILRDVGRWTPYAHGDTILLPTLVYFVPRVIWPDKPVLQLGREFGRLFRVTNTMTRETYVGVTLPGELYWNFNLPGIIVGMALFGAALRFLYRRYGGGRQLDPVSRAIHIMLLVQIAHLGGSLAADVVLVIRTLVMLEALRWLGRYVGILRASKEPT